MKNKGSRLVLDTNLWISFLISNDLTKLDEIILLRKCIFIYRQELIEEFLLVAQRPKFRRFFTFADIEKLLEIIDEYAEFINVKTITDACRDPKDNFLLSLSVDGKAAYLLTGDKDLLDLKSFGKTKIQTISEFLQGFKNA